jgi:hypothetical protein
MPESCSRRHPINSVNAGFAAAVRLTDVSRYARIPASPKLVQIFHCRCLMTKPLVRTRQRAQVESKLERKLLAYAAMAGAAGVTMLTTPPAAEAKVVYTKVNSAISPAFALDLNADGVNDFNLILWGAATSSFAFNYLNVCHDELLTFSHQCISSTNDPNAANLVRTVASGGAAALPFGAKIGPGEQWGGQGQPVLMGELIAGRGSNNTSQRWLGAWANGGQGVANRYLGLKFKIGNMFHYGWARVTFTTTAHNGFTATITGYAYETIPGKAIRAGSTSGTAETADAGIPADMQNVPVRTSSLGMLALGSSGLSIWRREEIRN